MDKAISVIGLKGGAGSANAKIAVLATRPDMRLIKLGYLVPLVLIVAGAMSLLLPLDDGTRFALSYAAVIFTACTLIFILSFYARLRRANYTVTTEHIEAQIGTFRKSVRLIPLSYIRDVTLSQNLFQSFFDTSNLTVAATNGDRIVLENVAEGKRSQEIIWKLVLAKSPGRSQSRNAN